jgi:Glycosyltransferase family 87
MQARRVPLALSTERVVLYACGLTLLCLAQIKLVLNQRFGDWTVFWSAGATAGTEHLLDPHKHADWQAAHHLPLSPFVYLPGTAWLFLPFKHLSVMQGYAFNAAIMFGILICAGLLCARIYSLPKWFAVLAVLAWAPAIAGVTTGQISPLGLLLSALVILAIVERKPFLAGAAAGLLLYKPPYAIPFLLFFLVRRDWRALAAATAVALVWYAASVTATGGDAAWPIHYVHTVQSYFGPDFAFNGGKAVSIPALLLRAHAPLWLATLVAVAMLFSAIPLLARRPMLEAASMTPLVGLAANPHTWPYDVVLALPALFFLMKSLPERRRTFVICALYLTAPLWFFTPILHFDVLAVLCIGLYAYWWTIS